MLRTARWMSRVIRIGPVRLLQAVILSAAVLMSGQTEGRADIRGWSRYVSVTTVDEVTVLASTSDRVAAEGVPFKLGAANLGAETTIRPYAMVWGRTAVGDGMRTFRTVAGDAAEESATTSARAVTVSNSAPPAAGSIQDLQPGIMHTLEPPTVDGTGVTRQSKHVTWTYHPPSGRLYSVGGDYAGESYRQDTYSLSLADRWADQKNPAAGWRLETPYCGATGGVQPKHPDYVGWAWDASRGVFWMVPGTMVIGTVNCPGETTNESSDPAYRYREIMSFNPTTKAWARFGTAMIPVMIEGDPWKAHYDPPTDSLYQFGWSGATGGRVNIVNLQTQTVTSQNLGLNAVGGDIRIFKEGSDYDPVSRVIYAVDGVANRLMRYNIASRTITDLGPSPGAGTSDNNNALLAWDTRRSVLYYWSSGTNTLHVYTPATRTWTTPPQPSSDGSPVRVRHAFVYDPGADVLALLGSTEEPSKLFLYRLPGGGGPPPSPGSFRRRFFDFSGDGTADILWRHSSGAVSLWFISGTENAGSGWLGTVDTDWGIQGVGDFNGDGQADILWRHSSGAGYLWLMNGTSIAGSGWLGTVGTDWGIQGVGDFNGDGKADILWRHGSGATYLWLMNGTTIAASGSPGTLGTDWGIQGVGDFNGDGKADILWRHGSGATYLWLMNGTSIAASGSLGTVGTDWGIQGVGDFNGDGKADILWRHSTGGVYIWLMNGATVVGSGPLGTAGPDWSID